MTDQVSFCMFQYENKWKISKYQLEAVLSLWDMSFDKSDDLDKLNQKVLSVDRRMMMSLYLAFAPIKRPGYFLDVPPNSGGDAWLIQQGAPCKIDKVDENSWNFNIRTRSPRIKLLAEHIFTLFLLRLSHIIDTDAKPNTKVAISDPPYGSNKILQHFRRIAKIFIDSGLGTEEEALICIIPVFVQSGVLMYDEMAVETFLQQGRSLRRQKRFTEAERLFTMAIDDGNAQVFEVAFLEILEVYRKAYRAGDQDWALRELEKMPNRAALKAQAEPERFSAKCANLHESLTKHRQSSEKLELQEYLAGLRNREITLECLRPLMLNMEWDLSSLTRSEFKDLLMSAIELSCLELVDDLVEANPVLIWDIMGSDWSLKDVIENLDVRVIEILINNDAININLMYSHMGNETILSLAISKGRFDIVQLIVKRGAQLETPTPTGGAIFACVSNKTGKAAWHDAAIESMKLLLDKGVSVDIEFRQETLLKQAVKENNEQATRLLLERGANLKNQWLLHEAANRGCVEVLEVLLDAMMKEDTDLGQEIKENPDHITFIPFTTVDAKDSSREVRNALRIKPQPGTVLHTAIKAKQAKVVRIFIQRNVLQQLDHAFPMACLFGDRNIIDAFLGAKPAVDINCTSELGSALAVACARRDELLVGQLLERGSSVTEAGGLLKSPLVVACLQNCESIVKQLLQRVQNQAEVLNAVGICGLTALCAAISKSNHITVKILLDKGADVNTASGEEADNLTPIVMCQKMGSRREILDLLQSQGANKAPGEDLQQGTSTINVENAERFYLNESKVINSINLSTVDRFHIEQSTEIKTINLSTVDRFSIQESTDINTINVMTADRVQINSTEAMTINIVDSVSTLILNDSEKYIFNSQQPST